MLAFLEGLLALVGFLTLVAACGVWFSIWLEGQVVEDEESSGPYREGLDASARISAMAWEAEQAMHQAALQSRRDDG